MSNKFIRDYKEFIKNSERIGSILDELEQNNSIDKKSIETISCHLDFAQGEIADINVQSELESEDSQIKLPGIWKLRHLQQHIAGQIFWCDEPRASAGRIAESIMNDPDLVDFLKLKLLKNVDGPVEFRCLEQRLREVSPRGRKKGRPRKNEILEGFRPSPLVYDKNTVNDYAIKMAIISSFIVLKFRNFSLDNASNHPVLVSYSVLAGHMAMGLSVQQILLYELGLK